MAAAEMRVIDGGRAEALEGRLPPQDLDAEACVLSAVMIDPDAIAEVVDLLTPSDFHSEAHRRTFEAALAVHAAGTTVDVQTVASWLRAHDRLAQVGGMAYLTEILVAAPAVGRRVRAYAEIVLERSVRRDTIRVCQRVCAEGYVGAVETEQLLMSASDALDGVKDRLARSAESMLIADVIAGTTKDLSTIGAEIGRSDVQTGFDRVDRMCAGLHPELELLGGRPGMGKTSLATSIAINVACAGFGAYLASLETKKKELTRRMLSAEARVDFQRMRSGRMNATDWVKYTAAASHVSQLPLFIDDEQGQTVTGLWAKVRRVKMALARDGKKLGIVVVDYVQLLRASRFGMKREEVVGENARALKAMAMELDVCVLGLAQLNREVDKRGDKRPALIDLRESGELEQCARTVLFLYREDYYQRKNVNHAKTGLVEVEIAKQNNGPTGTVRLHFTDWCMRFDNLVEGEYLDD